MNSIDDQPSYQTSIAYVSNVKIKSDETNKTRVTTLDKFFENTKNELDVVKIDGENVVGYGFHSNGRYAVSELLTKRFIPRIKEVENNELLNDDETNFSPEKIWKVLMRNEKPGGHGERSTAVGTIDMAVWDIVSKIENVPCLLYTSPSPRA